MTDVSAFKELVDRLHAKATSGKLEWTMNATNEYLTFLKSGYIKLWSRSNDLGIDDYVITIHNADGTITDEFDDNLLDKENIKNNLGTEYYGIMMDLLNLARRQSSGADQVLKSMLNELG